MRWRRTLVVSAAGGLGMTLLAAGASAYLALSTRDVAWLRTLCIFLGLLGSPFWWFVGLLGARTGGTSVWTIGLSLFGNVLFWAAPFLAFFALMRLGRGRKMTEAGRA
jgi:hypothetical protein